jgi:hypothetical protein
LRRIDVMANSDDSKRVLARNSLRAGTNNYNAAYHYSKATRAILNGKDTVSKLENSTGDNYAKKADRHSAIAKRAAETSVVDRRMANMQNANIAKSTGAPRALANVIGAVARNPGRAGLIVAGAAAAGAMFSSSSAKASGSKSKEPTGEAFTDKLGRHYANGRRGRGQ